MVKKEPDRMSYDKEVIVVAPDHYQDLGRKLSHEISKVPGCNGAFWTIKQYEDNEFQLGGNRYVILIGNLGENKITEDFLPMVKNLQNRAGACFGYDGSKALVFGEGNLEQAEAFQGVYKNIVDSKGVTGGNEISEGEGLSIAMKTILFPVILLGLVAKAFSFFMKEPAKKKKLLRGQTNAALTLFLTECFDHWVGIHKGQ
jgi:hypothetical protein